MRPIRWAVTWAATTSSARQPLQIWRVRSSGSRPWRPLTSAGRALRVPPLAPVDLVGLDAGGVVAGEQPIEALAQQLDGPLGDEALLDDHEAVVPKAVDLVVVEQIRGRREHAQVLPSASCPDLRISRWAGFWASWPRPTRRPAGERPPRLRLRSPPRCAGWRPRWRPRARRRRSTPMWPSGPTSCGPKRSSLPI